tara:strand:- start:1260 stop:2696 length:1437 start_codon:yes stop_codon:yes gene_type:complete
VPPKEKKLNDHRGTLILENPLQPEQEFKVDNETNLNNLFKNNINEQLESFIKKEAILKKKEISQKELIKKYEEEIKELKNLNQQYDKKIKNEIIKEVSIFFEKQKKRNTLKIIVDQQLEFKKLQKSINYLKENNKLLEASNLGLKSNLVKIAKLEKDLKNNKNELAKQKKLEGKIDIFEKRISDTEKEIETQSLVENKIAQLEKGPIFYQQETNKKEDTNFDKTNKINEINIDKNLKNDLYDVEQERLRTNDIIIEQEKQLKSLYEEKSELNQNMLDFQKNRNHLQSEFIYKQKELIKKHEDEIIEFQNLNKANNDKIVNLEEKNNDLKNKEDEINKLKNLNKINNDKIVNLEEKNNDLKNKDDEIKHYQNDNLRLSKELFENSKKLENTKAQLQEAENNKSQIKEQINDLNKTIHNNNIVESKIDQFSQNQNVQNISETTIEGNLKIEPDTNTQNLEKKNQELEDINKKVKNIFSIK